MPIPNPARSPSVTAAAVVAILGSVLIILVAGFGLVGIAMMQNMQAPPGAELPEVRYAAMVGVIFIAAAGIWGLASGIGLLRYRNWARISTLVWSGLAVPFGVLTLLFSLTMKFPTDPGAPGVEAAVRGFLVILYGVPIAIGIWWLILFTRKPIAALFAPSAVGPGALLDSSGFPATLAKVGPPLPVAIVAWFLIVSSPFGLGVLFFYQRFPLLLFGHLFHGPAGALFLLASAAICLAGGIGLLKLQPWAFWLIVSWQLFGLLNGTVSLLSPNYDSLMKEILAASRFPHAQDPAMPVQNYHAFAFLGLAFVAIVLIILLSYRSRFLATSANSRSSSS